jgi:riboflavin kinase/FMN adenylyltransferase
MKIIKNLKELTKDKKKNFFGVTLGNFDGIHLGHQEFLSFMAKDCLQNSFIPVIATFIPHPKLALGEKKPFLINDYDERRKFFENLGFKYFFEIEFSKNLSLMNPIQFLDEFLFNRTDIAKIYLGHDFSFGKNKSLGPNTMKEYCLGKKLLCHFQNEYIFGDESVSSSKIRKFINCGKMSLANKLLGRPFFITGNVIKGFGRGKKIGVPTANIKFSDDKIIPKNGVYITRVEIESEEYNSVTNIGMNPTFNISFCSVETHILNFGLNIYGKTIKVSFLKRIRDEIRFNSVEQLTFQINKDIEMTKEFFKL